MSSSHNTKQKISGMFYQNFKKKYLLCIYMQTKVTKWGNSYAIRLPKDVAQALELKEESVLHLERKGNTITLRKPAKEQQLSALLKNVTPQHEIDWGKGRGKEAW
jgi:antitoxin MazE